MNYKIAELSLLFGRFYSKYLIEHNLKVRLNGTTQGWVFDRIDWRWRFYEKNIV